MSTHSCHQHILGIISSVFDAYSTVLFLPSDSKQSYSVAAHFSLGDQVDVGCSITPGQGLVGWILRNQQPLLVNSFDQRRCFLGYYPRAEEAKIKAFMGYPLRKEQGVICLDSKRQYSFSDKDQKILQLFCDLIIDMQTSSCAMAETASTSSYYSALQLVYTLRTRVTRWRPFLEQFLAIVSQAIGFSHAYFCVVNEKKGTYGIEGQIALTDSHERIEECPLGSGLIGWVFNNAAPVFTDNKSSETPVAPLFGKSVYTPQFYSAICLPIYMHKRPRGVLCLANEHSVPVPEDLKGFVRMAAEHLALFLENLYLKNQLHDLENELGRREAATAQINAGAMDPEFFEDT